MKVLTVDIGNTSVSLGVYRNERMSGVEHYTPQLDKPDTVERYLKRQQVDAVAVASVVPQANTFWKQLLAQAGLPKPLFVDHSCKLGVAIDYPHPEQIGADRLANAAAAAVLFEAPSVVCDFGTALTFDVLDRERGYIGGVICPGLPLMFDYLAEKTALLPHVEPVCTRAVVGRNTTQAMQIGARLGYRGMIRVILEALQNELAACPLNVCCTGGYAEWIFKDWDLQAVAEKHLTLKGLGLIAEWNA